MLMTSLAIAISGIFAFGGRFMTYFAQVEEYGVPWLRFWAYGAYALAALFAVVTVVEFFKSIVRVIRRKRARRRGRC